MHLIKIICLIYDASEAGDEMVRMKLRQMNSLLRQSLTRHQSLYAKDILEMATLVNSKIKGELHCSRALLL